MSNFPNGITTAEELSTFQEYVGADPTKVHQYLEDFDTYRASEWTVTSVGTPVIILFDGDGGTIAVVNSAADNDSSFSQKVGESFLFEVGKKLWFESFVIATQPIESDWIIGLQITDTTPLSVSDGVYFRKNDNTSAIDFVVVKNNVETIFPSVVALTPTEGAKLAFSYNGVDKITVWIDSSKVAEVGVDNLPDDEVLTVSFGIQNGSAVAANMVIDYIFVAKER